MPRFQRLHNLFKGDHVIWIIFFLLCLISVMEVYSSSSLLGYKSGNYWSAALTHTVYLAFGWLCTIVVLNIPCRFFKIATPLLVPLSLILLVLVYLVGTKENDAARWLNLGFIPLQPSEIAKGTLVLAVAHILSQMQTPTGASPKALKYVGIIALPLILLVFPENFSTAALMGAVVIAMLVIGRVPAKQLGVLLSSLALMALLAVCFVWTVGKSKTELAAEAPQTELVASAQTQQEVEKATARKGLLHRLDLWKQRIDNFLDDTYVPPEQYDLDKNGQVGHANIAIASSHAIGVGPGNSVQRDFLPLAFSDFIYAIVFEELGLLGAVLVAGLYIFLLFRTGYIARNCQNSFPAFLAMGLALLIVMQAMFNMWVAVGLAPVTGQPLPLISKGGTSAIINCVYIGVILSISRTAKRRSCLAAQTERLNN